MTNWKKTRSSQSIKPNMEGWFIRWINGNKEIEIIKCKNFEVWEQINKGDSWDGDHLGSFKTIEVATRFARKFLND